MLNRPLYLPYTPEGSKRRPSEADFIQASIGPSAEKDRPHLADEMNG